MEKILFIMRGPSGSGKSTTATLLREYVQEPFPICSTDNFFVDRDGVYRFDASKLKLNHERNRFAVEELLQQNYPYVGVDNTNVKRWEFQSYVDLAVKYGYTVWIVYPDTEWDAEILAERNSHGVPLKTIERQISNFEPHLEQFNAICL